MKPALGRQEAFVDHCSLRWEAGKSLLVCIDKITCARMLQRIQPRWATRLAGAKTELAARLADLTEARDPDVRERLEREIAQLRGRVQWMESTIIEIIADYNREKDRATVEATFAQLVALAHSLDAEQRRAVEEGLSEDEQALFELLLRDDISKSDRERLKQASKSLLATLRERLLAMKDWTSKATTQADVKVFTLDSLYESLPRPPFTEAETEAIAARVYEHVWQQSSRGDGLFA